MKLRYYLLTLAVFVLDHLSKWIVRSRMDVTDKVVLIPDFFRLSYVQNFGVAFGFFADIQSVWKPHFLAGMAVIAAIVILMYSARMPSDRTLLQLALAVTLGGILGNFTDRLLHGFVVDFLEIHVRESFHWPTFNVADSAITAGIALLLIDTVRNPDTEEKETKTA